MSDTYSPFVKFTYTILDLDGHPQKKIMDIEFVIHSQC